MPLAYAPDALRYDGDSDTFGLRPDFDPQRHCLDIEGGGMLGHSAGDAAGWGDPFDPDIAQIRSLDGTPLHAGHALVTRRMMLAGPDGECILLDLLEIDHWPVCSLPSERLTPGIRYRVRDDALHGDGPPGLAGFGPGTPIATADGDIPVECLAPGDQIVTRGHGLQPLCWIGRTRLDQRLLSVRPDLKPVTLTPDRAPRASAPTVLVAPATLVLLAGAAVSLHFGFDAALARAGDLAGPGSMAATPSGLTYFTLLFDSHVILRAGDVWCDSLCLDSGTAARLSRMDAPPPQGIRHARSAAPCLADWETGLLRNLRDRAGAQPRRTAA